MRKLVASSLLALAAFGATAAPAADIVRNTLPAAPNGKPARILESVEVPAAATTLYVSGQLASPVDPAKPTEFGDTKTQALSTLTKIKAILEKRGYKMSDIVKMTLFLAPDPKLGKMDFDGVNAAFETFFNVAENPNTVARSAFQVGALAGPNFLVEIEVIAAKMK